MKNLKLMTKLMMTAPVHIPTAPTSGDATKQPCNRKCTHCCKYKHMGGNSKCWGLKSNKEIHPEGWISVKEQKKDAWQCPVGTQVVTEMLQLSEAIVNKIDADYIYLAATRYWNSFRPMLSDNSNSTFNPEGEMAKNSFSTAGPINPAWLMSKLRQIDATIEMIERQYHNSQLWCNTFIWQHCRCWCIRITDKKLDKQVTMADELLQTITKK